MTSNLTIEEVGIVYEDYNTAPNKIVGNFSTNIKREKIFFDEKGYLISREEFISKNSKNEIQKEWIEDFVRKNSNGNDLIKNINNATLYKKTKEKIKGLSKMLGEVLDPIFIDPILLSTNKQNPLNKFVKKYHNVVKITSVILLTATLHLGYIETENRSLANSKEYLNNHAKVETMFQKEISPFLTKIKNDEDLNAIIKNDPLLLKDYLLILQETVKIINNYEANYKDLSSFKKQNDLSLETLNELKKISTATKSIATTVINKYIEGLKNSFVDFSFKALEKSRG